MPKPKREEPWVAITARLSPDSVRRLRVAGARAGIPTGQVLDRLIQEGLPPDNETAHAKSSKRGVKG